LGSTGLGVSFWRRGIVWKDESKMALSSYQVERVADVRRWYEDIHRPLDGHAPESVRYMSLWAVFNALYNIADYPKVELKSVSSDDGKTKPYIHGRNDDKKLRFISRSISKDTPLVISILNNHFEFINLLAQRRPEVHQPSGVTSINFEHSGQSYTLELSDLYGIASIDNRLFLENGSVLFHYHHLELDLDKDNLPKDCQKFCRQLIFVLYQLRNNIVHGGSAAFFMRKTELSIGAMRLLDDIVRHLLDHPELLEQDGK
jgi:hypothetical protein